MLLKKEVSATRAHWAAQYFVLGRANSAIRALCVLVLRVPIALWRRNALFQQPGSPSHFSTTSNVRARRDMSFHPNTLHAASM